MTSMEHANEIAAGERFKFGENWGRYLRHLSDRQIDEAVLSLTEMLSAESLVGKRFIDVGSGSGLFSLAARRLGANVTSIDFDPASVACTRALKNRYSANDKNWSVEEGANLDDKLVAKLGTFELVYCWGAHHTGQMWHALENVSKLVASGGICWLAIYNDGAHSRRWRIIKRLYCKLPGLLRPIYAALVILPVQSLKLWNAFIRFRAIAYFREILNYRRHRGMSWWHDQVDWIGGYPYETAKPEQILAFYRNRHFQLTWMSTVGGGTGCNQLLFVGEQ